MERENLPPGAETDPFYPPSISTLVHCIHCHEEYDSWRIEWRVFTYEDGSTHGFWCCPIKDCDGKGFGFDISPVDPTYVDPDGRDMGWSDSDEDEDGAEDEEFEDEDGDEEDWDEEDDDDDEEWEEEGEEEDAGGLAVEERPGGSFLDEIGYLRDDSKADDDSATPPPQRPMNRPLKNPLPIDDEDIPY